jgi:predicted dehydrogenase
LHFYINTNLKKIINMEHRRQFIKKMVAGGAAASAFPHLVLGNESFKGNAAQQEIRIASIGNGSMGTDNTRTALRIPGVRLVAVCDLYEVRLQNARNNWGNDIFTTRDYKEILSRNDVDAVIVATPDHWHQQISIEAMKAGKHVYCEKPVIHKFSEAHDLIAAQQATGKVFITGSQGMSSIGNRKAKQLVQSGAIGNVSLVEGVFTSRPRRNCNTPAGIMPADVWWERYITNAPNVPFDPSRFFCWRHWQDYGTGIAGDLFVHVLSSLQYIMDVPGPEKVYTAGNPDGIGDTPYIMLSLFDYPAKNGMKPFKAALTANYADPVSGRWGSVDFMIIGDEGTLRVQWDRVTLRKANAVSAADFSGLARMGNSIDTPRQVSDTELLFVETGYNNCHVDHFTNFFNGMQ